MATTPTKPWYLSKGVWGSVVVIAALVLGWFGQQEAAENVQAESESITGLVSQIAALVGGVIAFWGRITAKTPIG